LHVHRAGGGGKALELLENEPGESSGLLQAENSSLLGAHRAADRGWARLILDRLHDLVLSPSDSKGSTLDPDTAAHEHHSFFFPDNENGAANAAGFGWRNGG
jgi:hypothetical protein